MKLVAFVFLSSAAANAVDADLLHRHLRVATSDLLEPSFPNIIEADLRDDELGANADFWGTLDPPEDSEPQAPSVVDNTRSAGGIGVITVGDAPGATDDIYQKAESVMTAALPFDVEHAKSFLLPVGLAVAALFVVAFAAVLVGVYRQHFSNPMFGPVELVSDLPEPTTVGSGDESDTGSPTGTTRHVADDEADTGVTILAGAEEKEEEKQEEVEEEEEEGEFDVALA